MKNDIFENEECKIENGELIEYFGEKKKVIINHNIEGHTVTKIGVSVCGTKKIDTLIVQEGIKEIEECAFYRSDIKSLVFPTTVTRIGKDFFRDHVPENIVISRKISKLKWSIIRTKCIPIMGGKFLLTNQHTGEPVLDAIIKSYAQYNLFHSEIVENMVTLFAAGQGREDIVFDSKRIKSEEYLIGYLIRNGILLDVDEKVDYSDDCNYRSSYKYHAKDVVLCKLSVEDDGGVFDNVVVKAHFVKGIYYWRRIEKIIYKGKPYFVLSKEFLNPSDEIPYFKRVENIYTATEKEVTGKEKALVFRKYNLLRNIP